MGLPVCNGRYDDGREKTYTEEELPRTCRHTAMPEAMLGGRETMLRGIAYRVDIIGDITPTGIPCPEGPGGDHTHPGCLSVLGHCAGDAKDAHDRPEALGIGVQTRGASEWGIAGAA